MLGVFSVTKECAAVTAGGDFWGWGGITNKHYRGFPGDGKSSVIGKLT